MDNNDIRCFQITDMHLFAGADGTLLGVNTNDSLTQVLDLAKQNQDPDIVLLTGDLTQDYSIAAYQRVVNQFSCFQCPVHPIAGNHDSMVNMHRVFGNTYMNPNHFIEFEHWVIILLTSHVPGKVFGRLEISEMEFLQDHLKKVGDRSVMIVMHHHPVPIGTKWLNPLGVQEPEWFLHTIHSHPQVKMVVWGHIHQEFHQHIDGIDFIATPSTCIQFKPGKTDFTLDEVNPGYREFILQADGSFKTEVHRLTDYTYTYDLDSEGY